MKLTDLKIDLLLNENLIEKYKKNKTELQNILLTIFYLDDFLEIDDNVKNRLINLVDNFKEYETCKLIYENPESLINDDIYGNRKNLASLKFLEDLNNHIKNNELDLERLSSSYNSILALDEIYYNNNREEKNKSTIDKLFDIKYKLYSFGLKRKIENKINKTRENIYKQKIKKQL